jgi:hypothetical protein
MTGKNLANCFTTNICNRSVFVRLFALKISDGFFLTTLIDTNGDAPSCFSVSYS